MSGSQTPHLLRRNGIYYLRVRVPNDLRSRFGLLEVRRSLRQFSQTQARRLAMKHGARAMELFEMVRAQELSKDDVRVMVSRFFADLSRETDRGFVPGGEDPEQEVAYWRSEALDRMSDIQGQLSSLSFGPPVTGFARSVFPDVAELPPGERSDLLSGVARALIEQHRLFLFRLEERLLPYVVEDRLFSAGTVGSVSGVDVGSSPDPEPAC